MQLKLTIQRCKMLQEKKVSLSNKNADYHKYICVAATDSHHLSLPCGLQEAMAKQARRDISTLVEKGKLETARIKTEGIISEDIHLELLELMELYAETLLARFALLDLSTREPDVSILPALTAIIHAAPRTELKELHVLREMLMAKFGREFAQDVMDNKDGCVPERVMSKLLVDTPDAKLVDLYIFEICKAYDVPFSSPLLPETKVEEVEEKEEEKEVEAEVTSDAKEGAENVKADKKDTVKTDGATTDGKEEYDSLEARFAALKRR